MTAPGEFLNLRDAASYCGLSVASLRRAIQDGRLRSYAPTTIPGHRRGRRIVRRRDLEGWICARLVICDSRRKSGRTASRALQNQEN